MSGNNNRLKKLEKGIVTVAPGVKPVLMVETYDEVIFTSSRDPASIYSAEDIEQLTETHFVIVVVKTAQV